MGETDLSQQRERLRADLVRVRQTGITRLRALDLPALAAASRTVLGDDSPSSLERLLRQVLLGLGGGDFARSAELLFGLAQGTRGRRPPDLRKLAAAVFDVQVETFRKDRERQILAQMAEQLVGLQIQRRVTDSPSNESHEDRRARLERIAKEISELPAADLGLLVPLLQERLNMLR